MLKCYVPTIRVKTVSTSTTSVTFTVGGFVGSLNKCGKFNLCLPQCIPMEYAGATITLTDGTNTWPMLDRSGNNLRVGQLLCMCCKCGKLLHCRLMNDPAHVYVCDKLPLDCNSALSFPTVTAGATPASA